MIKKIFLSFLLLIAAVLIIAWVTGSAVLVDQPDTPAPVKQARPSSASDDGSQIYFGDLHTHTSYSMDAALFDTPMVKNSGYTTPADACDFARYCSGLDFWSINDHAEGLASWQWQATKTAIQQCNAVTDPAAPDMVSFLGWEWSQGQGGKVESHYGHKNVIFRQSEQHESPSRPIAAGPNSIWRMIAQSPAIVRGLFWMWQDGLLGSDYDTVAHHIQTTGKNDNCGEGDVRDLPADCYEVVDRPSELYTKLDQWGFDALVIPHGLAWGTTNPINSDFNVQMDQLNDKYQRLLEVFSGHGNSEVYRKTAVLSNPEQECPMPVDGYTPCCWQAGTIIEKRCTANGSSDCKERAGKTRELYVKASGGIKQIINFKAVVPDTTLDDWGQCDQIVDSFQPAHDYQAKQSAQYILSLGDNDNRFRPGFIGSSDNHLARPGNSYSESQMMVRTDTKGNFVVSQPVANPSDQPREATIWNGQDTEDNADGFYYTGGLVAVHAKAKTQDAIWQALYDRKVYGTSGPRIQLWFDLVTPDGEEHTMGSQLALNGTPQFKVAARGSLKQNPGCPSYVEGALGADRMASLCLNECQNPSNEAHKIDRLEVVRILPRTRANEKTQDLIQDPWRSFKCNTAAGETCTASFSDPQFDGLNREAAYYVRAIQEPTEAINGDPFHCDEGDNGECLKTNICMGDLTDKDCLAPTQHRAWSSPIYLTVAGI